MLLAVIGWIPRQFVNDSKIDARVGSQMNDRHRMVGMPTIKGNVTLSRRGQQRVAALAARDRRIRPTGLGTRQGG